MSDHWTECARLMVLRRGSRPLVGLAPSNGLRKDRGPE